MYTLSYSHSLHANTGSEESTRRAGGLVTPNPSVISMGHPECPGRGPAPGASPALGRVMGGTDQSPQCYWAGSPVGGVSLGRGQITETPAVPSCRMLAGPRGALQGQIPGSSTAHPDLEVPKSSWGDAVSGGLALLGGTQHTTAPGRPSLGPHMLLQHNSYP